MSRIWPLGTPQTVWKVDHLVKIKCPNFVLFIKTKCNRGKVEKVRNQIGYDESFKVDNNKGWIEGLAFTHRHISIIVMPKYGKKCLLTVFYGIPLIAKRKANWALMLRFEIYWLDLDHWIIHKENNYQIILEYASVLLLAGH